MNSEMQISVSQIFKRNGQKYVFVSFLDNLRAIEFRIPDGTVMSGEADFTPFEVQQMREYLVMEEDTIWAAAKGINSITAFMK